jgi:hypothetical protein
MTLCSRQANTAQFPPRLAPIKTSFEMHHLQMRAIQFAHHPPLFDWVEQMHSYSHHIMSKMDPSILIFLSRMFFRATTYTSFGSLCWQCKYCCGNMYTELFGTEMIYRHLLRTESGNNCEFNCQKVKSPRSPSCACFEYNDITIIKQIDEMNPAGLL